MKFCFKFILSKGCPDPYPKLFIPELVRTVTVYAGESTEAARHRSPETIFGPKLGGAASADQQAGTLFSGFERILHAK